MENSSRCLPIPVELLGLDDIEILDVSTTTASDIIIKVMSTKDEVACHKCGAPTQSYGYGRPLIIRHLPILGKATYIEITPPRGICKKCDNSPTTTQTLCWHDRNARYTKAYEQHILFSLKNSTIVDVSVKENLSEGAIQNVVGKYIKTEIDWRNFNILGLIGIDEISLKKGHRDFVTIITSRLNGENKILTVLKGRDKTKVKAFFNSIPKKKRKTIVAICCDMYDGYVNAAHEVFGDNVPVIIDRFHVAKLYRKSLVLLRKKELVRLRKALSDAEYKSLKSAISILVSKKELYTKKEKRTLEPLFKYSPALKAAYKLARQLTSIYNTNHKKKTANKKINEWIEKVNSSEITCFDIFIGTLIKYQNDVTNYFTDRNTSGFVEGLNNKFKVIKRRCYGIVNIKHFFQRIFLDLTSYSDFIEIQLVTLA